MFIVEMKRTMKYKRKTLRRRSRARKQRGGALGDIAKYFSLLHDIININKTIISDAQLITNWINNII